MSRIILIAIASLVAICFTGCEVPQSNSETLESVEDGLDTPVVSQGPCPNGSYGSTVINPSSVEYRALSSGVEQIAILSDFRMSYQLGLRGDDPVLQPFYDAIDRSEGMAGPFSLETIDGVERVIDQNGIPVVMPFDSGFENEPDLIDRANSIASFMAAERLGVRSSDPRLSDLYALLESERDSNVMYALGIIEGTSVTAPVRCD